LGRDPPTEPGPGCACRWHARFSHLSQPTGSNAPFLRCRMKVPHSVWLKVRTGLRTPYLASLTPMRLASTSLATSTQVPFAPQWLLRRQLGPVTSETDNSCLSLLLKPLAESLPRVSGVQDPSPCFGGAECVFRQAVVGQAIHVGNAFIGQVADRYAFGVHDIRKRDLVCGGNLQKSKRFRHD